MPLTIIPGSIPAIICGLRASPKMKGSKTTRNTGKSMCLIAVKQAGRIVPP